MTKPGPLLVFDLDGTLADTAGDLIATLNRVLALENIAPVPVADARPMVGAGARALILRGAARQGVTLPPATVEALFQAFIADYAENIAVETRLFAGLAEALDRFEAAGFAFAICTNKTEALSLRLMEHLGLTARFGAICGQDTFWLDGKAIAKPHPHILHETVARCGGALADAIMIGDTITDVETARAAGIPVIAVDFGYAAVPAHELGADMVISHFDDLWDAVQALRHTRRADVKEPAAHQKA